MGSRQAMSLALAQSLGDGDGVHGGFHVMNADDVGAFENCGGDDRHGTVQTVESRSRRAGVVGQYVSNKRLARWANEKRQVRKHGYQLIEARDQLEVLLLRFAEADAGIDDY